MNATYDPEKLVQLAHNIPRWFGSEAFAIDERSYWVGVLTIPILVTVPIWLVNILVGCCLRGPKRRNGVWHMLTAFAFVLMAAGLIVTLYKNHKFTDGVADSITILDKLHELAVQANNAIDYITTNQTAALASLHTIETNCTAASQMAASISKQVADAGQDVHEVSRFLSPLPDALDSAHSGADKGNAILDASTKGVIYGLGGSGLLLVVLVAVIAMGARSLRFLLKLGLCLLSTFLTLLWVVLGVVGILIIVTSDACMNPDDNINAQVQRSDMAAKGKNMTSYYIYCNSSSPYINDISTARQSLLQAQVAVKTMGPVVGAQCQQVAASVKATGMSIAYMNGTLEKLAHLSDCSVIHPLYHEGVVEDFCLRDLPHLIMLTFVSFLTLFAVVVLMFTARQAGLQRGEYVELEEYYANPQNKF